MYFEVKFLKDIHRQDIGIGVKLNTAPVLYLPNNGVILGKQRIIHTGKTCQPDDTICCRIALNLYSTGGQQYNRVTFSINGKEIGDSIMIIGVPPVSFVAYEDSTDVLSVAGDVFELNLDEDSYEHKTGTDLSLLIVLDHQISSIAYNHC